MTGQTNAKPRSSRCRKYLPLIVALGAISLVLFPQFWVYPALALDFYTPWHLHDSNLWRHYHDLITSLRPDRDPLPLPEIQASEFTREKLLELSDNFAFPLVIRGALKDMPALKLWSDKKWWIENYGDEEVISKPVTRVYGGSNRFFATIKEWAEKSENDGVNYYIAGASSIFKRRQELVDMIESPITRNAAPNVGDDPINLQLFMGTGGSGSPIHAGFGINLFRMVVGRKRWWFIPPSETAWLIPSITANGFSMHSAVRMAPIGGNVTDPVVKKLLRYTAVLEPGDLLINPPWFWHAIENIDSFTIGVPSRYGGDAALRTNPIVTRMAYTRFIQQYGTFENFKNQVNLNATLINGRDILEQSLADNRVVENYDGSNKKNQHFD